MPAEPLIWYSLFQVVADGYGTCILFHIPRNWVQRAYIILLHSDRDMCITIFISLVGLSWSPRAKFVSSVDT
jgi:hypothetical protein